MLTQEQLAACFESTLTPEERAKVEELLAHDVEARRALFDQQRFDQALRVLFSGTATHEQVKQSILAVVKARSLEDLKAQVLETTLPGRKTRQPLQLQPIEKPRNIIRHFKRRALPAWSIGLAAAACLAFILFFPFRNSATSVATVAEITPPVFVKRAGAEQAVSAGFALRDGDVLSVTNGGSALIGFADATRLHFGSDSQVIFGNQINRTRGVGKHLELTAGTLIATVSKQQQPFTIGTPHANVTVVGTVLTVKVEAGRTQVGVREGAVQVSEPKTGKTINVSAGQVAAASPGGDLRAEPESRDRFLWPFSAASPWNRSLGAGARFAPIDSPGFDPHAEVKWVIRAIPLFESYPGFPTRQVIVNGSPAMTIRATDQWKLPLYPEIPMGILDEQKRNLTELLGVKRLANGDLAANDLKRGNLQGSGIGPENEGTAGFGGSCFGGVIRHSELLLGIRHALAIHLPQRALNSKGPEGRPFIWPAIRANVEIRPGYADHGNLFVGALLAIPPSVDIAKLGVGTSGPGYEIAKALQDYGGYVVDATERGFQLYFNYAEIPPNIDELVSRIVPHLQVVTNNSPLHPGGGGVPRRAEAPPFQEK